MGWIFAALIVLVLGGVGLVAAGAGAPLGEDYGDQPDALVPRDRAIGAADLANVRFSVALRGYRMEEVDALIARLREEAEWRETTGSDGAESAGSEVGAAGVGPHTREPDSGSPDV
ncbi:DivIVA domain-containing protein [Nocardioides albertanoniae]|uniref:DivIVA domain-containing protein n=1 Tax=Nocardioides albertanoniae TaxID=1175486 RepID=A0A543AAR8_9ACTN|nr:DivIVA domain-containing protein [Nocardioides albertanoniae]TQL69702.1 DivIVA domain-containing protein [Nocardioides albertanoniae]